MPNSLLCPGSYDRHAPYLQPSALNVLLTQKVNYVISKSSRNFLDQNPVPVTEARGFPHKMLLSGRVMASAQSPSTFRALGQDSLSSIQGYTMTPEA